MKCSKFLLEDKEYSHLYVQRYGSEVMIDDHKCRIKAFPNKIKLLLCQQKDEHIHWDRLQSNEKENFTIYVYKIWKFLKQIGWKCIQSDYRFS